MGFLLTGFTWLALSFLLGIGLIIGLVYGTPLPHWLKPIHVHGALVGGGVQLAIGALLASIRLASERKEIDTQSHRALFLTLNGATAALLVGFWLGSMTIVGLAGLIVMISVLPFLKTAWIHLGKGSGTAGLYRIALAALFAGLATGMAMAFRLTDAYYAHARLVHIHLIVMGGLTLSIIVTLHQLIPALVGTPPLRNSPARFALWFLAAGFAVLLGAFLIGTVWLQISVGCLVVAAVTFSSFHLVRAWFKAGSPKTASTEHLLIGMFFLLLAAATGLAMSANYLRNPPFLPIGSLHLVAYTHLAFIGFLTQVICGGLSYLVPQLLASGRVANHAKREIYRAQLDRIMNRWRTVQLAGMSFGTVALCVLASLTWSVPLGSSYVQASVWIAAGLLVASLTLFAAKLAWAVGFRPS
ncbi:MAG TPA: hypothetical protein VFL19_03090 [Nitrospira sp.]|nr:hypothetical protein [Nitrospira sp.]